MRARSLPRLVPARLALLAAASCAAPPPAGVPWPLAPSGWRTDPAWHDGRAEVCTYEATRTIYGLERRFVATAYTNKQRMDERTTTKAEGDAAGVEVFKHHWSERVPTERYDYDLSTATFTRTADLAPYKLTAATQEDCGASFKLLWREGERLAWLESVYLPGAGLREGALDARGVACEDALTLVLRDFPFEGATAGTSFPLALVPSQRSTRSVPFAPRAARVRYGGREPLALPAGALDAHRLVLEDAAGAALATYWFAADGTAPWLHALVRYEGPDGLSYRLRSLAREAYWER